MHHKLTIRLMKFKICIALQRICIFGVGYQFVVCLTCQIYFGQKSKICSKIDVLFKNRTFVQKNPIFWLKIEDLFKKIQFFG